jgi:hypothetical protein
MPMPIINNFTRSQDPARLNAWLALADIGAAVMRFESSQHAKIDEGLSITETNTLSTERLRVYRSYAARNFLDE